MVLNGPGTFERSKPRCGGYVMRRVTSTKQMLSSSPCVTSPRVRSVADLPAELHNGFHAKSFNRRNEHTQICPTLWNTTA